MKTLYFVRHGECLANVEGRIAGSRNDSPLTELGRRQANETAELLNAKGLAFDLIVSSPRTRTKDTARIIAERVGYKGQIRTELILEERDLGFVSGELRSVGLPLIDAGKVEDAESMDDFADRQRRVLELFKILPGQHILVIGHSSAEQMLRTIYEGRPYQTFLKTETLQNGTYREYEVDDK